MASCDRAAQRPTKPLARAGRCNSEGLPLFDELAALDRNVHALFAELLARKGQPRKTQKIVRGVYEVLQQLGQISPAWATSESRSDSDPKTAEPREPDGEPSSED